MKPKSHKIFKEDIADEIGVHPSVVDDLISFYYSKVRQSLSNIDDIRIYIEAIGTFAIRKARLEKAIIKNKSYLGNLEKHTYNGYEKTLETKKKIEKLEFTLQRIEDSINSRQQFKKDKS